MPQQVDARPAAHTLQPEQLWRLGVAVAAAAVFVVMLLAGGGPTQEAVTSLWHLLDVSQLESNPFTSLWFLHTQPPVFNALIAVLTQLPVSISTSLTWVLGVAHVGTAILVFNIVRWFGLDRPVAAVGSVLVVANPNLTSTVYLASSELLVAFLVTLAIWLLTVYLDRPSAGPLLALSSALTAVALTRSAFHPVWVAVILGVVLLTRRPPSRRQIAAAVAIPVILIGAVAAKNQVNVGSFSMSSWGGFNLQRGVVAAMTRDQVRTAISDPRNAQLATTPPWLTVDQYPPAEPPCVASHANPVLLDPLKGATSSIPNPNFNHECYLPLYRQSAANAAALIRRYPGRYLATRRAPLLQSFSTVNVGAGEPGQSIFGTMLPSRSWVDRLYRPILLPVSVEIDQSDWNLPLFPGAPFPFDVSITLLLAYVGVALRGAVASARFALHIARRRLRAIDRQEAVWIVVLITQITIIIGGAAVEFGENGRFRAVLDPLVCSLALVLLVRMSMRAWRALGPVIPLRLDRGAAP
ncbi:MAG: glycosyltransferase family 39 protein [Candidatus Microthrix sp.]|nr:glycosyltransferase family 39 protein [Candidatus Microthrix sp.]